MILLSTGDISLFIKPNLVFLLAATLLLPSPAPAQSSPVEKEDQPRNPSYSIKAGAPTPEGETATPTQDTSVNEPLEVGSESAASKNGDDNNSNRQQQQPKSDDWKSKVSVVPGPLESERGELLLKIMNAQKQGVNIIAYLTAFKDIEELVKAGTSIEVLQQRVGSIERGLKDQLSRKEVLKNKGPTPMDKRHPKILAPGQVVPPEWRWRPY